MVIAPNQRKTLSRRFRLAGDPLAGEPLKSVAQHDKDFS
jgi:hypothetical protein